MKFSHINLLTSALVAAITPVLLQAFEPEIKLAGRKDLVLGIESRQTVLQLSEEFLAPPSNDFLPVIEDLTDPFSFEEATPVAPVEKDVEEVPESPAVEYDDADVLALSATSFAKKVRGSIVRGDTSYLQLEGGALLKPGTSFPVRLPQARGQTFTLTITEITSEGYTLQMGEATMRLNFNGKSPNNSIQFTNP